MVTDSPGRAVKLVIPPFSDSLRVMATDGPVYIEQ